MPMDHDGITFRKDFHQASCDCGYLGPNRQSNTESVKDLKLHRKKCKKYIGC